MGKKLVWVTAIGAIIAAITGVIVASDTLLHEFKPELFEKPRIELIDVEPFTISEGDTETFVITLENRGTTASDMFVTINSVVGFDIYTYPSLSKDILGHNKRVNATFKLTAPYYDAYPICSFKIYVGYSPKYGEASGVPFDIIYSYDRIVIDGKVIEGYYQF